MLHLPSFVIVSVQNTRYVSELNEAIAPLTGHDGNLLEGRCYYFVWWLPQTITTVR